MNGNNEFYQNSMINARKDNDEWKNAAGTCSPNLIEKSITENGDYSAKADGADGYSSVTVNVLGDFNKISTYYSTGSGYGRSQYPLMIYKNASGVYDFSDEEQDVYRICVNPLKKAITTGPVSIEFTPSVDFDGFYGPDGTKLTPTGDTVSAGDGNVYRYGQASDASIPPTITLYIGGEFEFTVE